MSQTLPRMFRIRQNFPRQAPLDLPRVLHEQFQRLHGRIKPGARIAIGLGSRGIANLLTIASQLIEHVRAAGGEPFVVPAMGSHGGATPEGQRDVLASYGLTEASLNAPIHPSMEVQEIGTSADGVSVYCSVEALRADGVLIVNRIKPHTDFSGTL